MINNLTKLYTIVLLFASCQPADKAKEVTVPEEFKWEYASPESQGFSSQKIENLTNQLSDKGTKKLLIIRNDKIISEWTKEGWDDSYGNQYAGPFAHLFAGGLSLLAALDDGYISPDQQACHYIPSWRRERLKFEISIRHLATHTSGLENESIPNPEKGVNGTGEYTGSFPMARDNVPVLSKPGTKYHYSVPGLAILSHVIALSIKDSPYNSIGEYVKGRILDPIGIGGNEKGLNKPVSVSSFELGSDWAGNSFTASSIARIGRLMLNKGVWQGKQVIKTSAIEEAIRPYRVAIPSRDGNMGQTSLSINNKKILTPSMGWYSNYNGVMSYVPRDAFMTGFPTGDLLLIIPSLNLIVVHIGDALVDGSDNDVFWSGAEEHLFNPLIEAFEEPPYPQSDLITSLEFAPKETVIRLARGSDTWPITWADDDNLYTGYGDGNGFEPFTEYKLSMGIAMVKGTPPDIEGINIRTSTAEIPGDGPHGPKPSGMLMVDKVLYMFVRNAGNSRLAWSSDYGKTWEWADWHFEFVYPTFVNYGKNYDGAIDEYVYIYSFDDENSISPYMTSNHMVLARVHKYNIRNWREYEYFAGYGKNNKPIWSEDIRKREPVFTNPGKCHRAGISYHKGLGRYLWCQTIPTPGAKQLDTRFRGGLGIFESQNPWGPWKTVYYSLDWDIGPGETSSIPPKWISDDGKTCYLLFSGDDYFSVRKLELKFGSQ
jgi:CubicO group peptidase (beta-lactamase class C family)